MCEQVGTPDCCYCKLHHAK